LYLRTLEETKKVNAGAAQRASAVGLATNTNPMGGASAANSDGGTSSSDDEPAQWDWDKNEEVPKPTCPTSAAAVH